jgi:hypothetical protein
VGGPDTGGGGSTSIITSAPVAPLIEPGGVVCSTSIEVMQILPQQTLFNRLWLTAPPIAVNADIISAITPIVAPVSILYYRMLLYVITPAKTCYFSPLLIGNESRLHKTYYRMGYY